MLWCPDTNQTNIPWFFTRLITVHCGRMTDIPFFSQQQDDATHFSCWWVWGGYWLEKQIIYVVTREYPSWLVVNSAWLSLTELSLAQPNEKEGSLYATMKAIFLIRVKRTTFFLSPLPLSPRLAQSPASFPQIFIKFLGSRNLDRFLS